MLQTHIYAHAAGKTPTLTTANMGVRNPRLNGCVEYASARKDGGFYLVGKEI